MDNNDLHVWLMHQHAQKHARGVKIENPRFYAPTCRKCHLQVINQPAHNMLQMRDEGGES